MICISKFRGGLTLKSKTWKLNLLASMCFLLAGIISLVDKSFALAIAYIFLAGLNFLLSRNNYKVDIQTAQIELDDTALRNMNVELKKLIEENKKIKAIKQYRVITGLGLKEAKEYIDLLSQEKI
jgi:hypothetical protein